ncbi:hypothetical protein O181_029416 [Austropuccinia psidii MF-1]|uniref:Uncharacterized protein n=1 Tax=Austropuccinia psidii MF-1 TaxID=1389203 RepID=A0A9Q3H3A2_9BASI|nr:hypothetical protein [Austropuccinia psidii MF-1]
MLADKHTRNARSLSDPSDHTARGVPAQDTLVRTLLCSTMMKLFPSGNGHWDPKQSDWNDSGQLALSLPVLICPPPLLGHHPMVTSLLEQSKVIIWPMKDGNGKRTFKLGLIVTMSCHTWDSNAKVKQNPPNPLQQYSPVLCMPCEQTLRQPTPGPSGTQWSEDLYRSKHPTFPFLILTFASSSLTLPPFVEPSQHNEPPTPGRSPTAEPPEDVSTGEPELEVAPTQSTEEPFGKSSLLALYSYQLFLTPPSTISSSSRYSLLPNHH